MIKTISAALAAALLCSCGNMQHAQLPTETQAPHHEAATHNLIIFYDAQTGSADLLEAVNRYGAQVIYEYRHISGIAIRLPDKANPADAVRHFQAVRGVLGVNEDGMLQLH